MSWLRSPHDLRKLLESNPKFASTPAESFGGELPLHQAVLNKSPLEIIQLLVSAFPGALNCTDTNRNTPLHCACALMSVDVIELLLDSGASPLIKNSEGMIPLETVGSIEDGDDAGRIKSLLVSKQAALEHKLSRQNRREDREALWQMTESEALLECATHGSIPLYGNRNLLLPTTPSIPRVENSDKPTAYVRGSVIVKELAAEDNFHDIIYSAMESCDDKEVKSIIEVAVKNCHVDMAESLLPYSSTGEKERALGIVEEAISKLMIDAEFACLSLRRGRVAFGASKDSKKSGISQLDAAMEILHLLNPKHMLFVERRLREQQHIQDDVAKAEGKGGAENVVVPSYGIDEILTDPKDKAKRMNKIAKRVERRKIRRQRKARRQVEKQKEAAQRMRDLEKERRRHNAKLLLNGMAYDVEKKKYWFESSWTPERFMIGLDDKEKDDYGDDYNFQSVDDDESNDSCCTIS